MSDIPSFLDLTLFDTDPVDIVAAARLRALVNFPGLNVEEGSYEAAIFEVEANMVAEMSGTVNRLPRAINLDLAYNFFQIQPDPGAAPSVVATLTVAVSSGVTVVAGTLVELDVGDGSPVQFVLTIDAVVAPGDTTASGTFTALSFTSKANGVAPGAILRIVSSTPTLVSAITTGAVTGGRDPETLTSYLDRIVSVLANLSSTLTLARHFTNAALQNSAVARATTIDRYDGSGGPPYTNNGHVTVAVLGPDGATVSSPDKAQLLADLSADARVDLVVHIIDPVITPVAVTATVEALPGSDSTVVHDAVVAALTAYLNTDSWQWGGTVYRFELVKIMAAVTGVNRVVSITTPASDLAISGDAPLASAGTFTITVA